jgi:NADH-ubiquinone oxidoreductase chain 6
LNKLYNFPTNFLTVLLINYLFLTLIAAVKVTNVHYGPLRPQQ